MTASHGQSQAGHELFGVGRESIDLTFGGVTIVTAVVATLLGGWALDRVGSSIKNAMLLNGTPIQLRFQYVHVCASSMDTCACMSRERDNLCMHYHAAW